MNEIVDVLTAIVIVGGILVLTRSGSQGPALVQNLASGFSFLSSANTAAAMAGVNSFDERP